MDGVCLCVFWVRGRHLLLNTQPSKPLTKGGDQQQMVEREIRTWPSSEPMKLALFFLIADVVHFLKIFFFSEGASKEKY